MPLKMLDISGWQKGIPADTITRADVVFVKATERTDFENPVWKDQIKAAKDAGKPVGLYHFQRGGGLKELDWFLKVTEGYWDGQTIPVLDLESPQAVDDEAGALAWLNKCEAATGRRPWVYTGLANLREHKGYKSLHAYPLWLAAYPAPECATWEPSKPFSWVTDKAEGCLDGWLVVAWQHTSKGRLPGWKDGLDFSEAYWTLDQFKGNGKTSVPTPKPVPAKTGPALVVDGIVGAKTATAFNARHGVNGSIITKVSVSAWQKKLGTPSDGIISGQTSPAPKGIEGVAWGTAQDSRGSKVIAKAQELVGLPVTGIADPMFWKAVQTDLNKGPNGVL